MQTKATKRKTTKPRKKENKRAPVRVLKIQHQCRKLQRKNVRVPYIRLAGNWLQGCGFEIYDKINVTVMNKLLVIRVEERV